MKERVLPHYFAVLHIKNGRFCIKKFDFKKGLTLKKSNQKLPATSMCIHSFVWNLKLESTLLEVVLNNDTIPY